MKSLHRYRVYHREISKFYPLVHKSRERFQALRPNDNLRVSTSPFQRDVNLSVDNFSECAVCKFSRVILKF